MIKDAKQETDQGYSQSMHGDSGDAYWVPSVVRKEQRQTVIAVDSVNIPLSKAMRYSKSHTNTYEATRCHTYATKLRAEIVQWIKDIDNS